MTARARSFRPHWQLLTASLAAAGLFAWTRLHPPPPADAVPEALLRMAVSADPDYALGHYDLGALAENRGAAEEAYEAYRRAHLADPRSRSICLALGQAAVKLRRWPEAESALRCADPTDPRTHERLGLALLNQGRPQQAADELEAALAGAELPEARVNLGVALAQLGKAERARVLLRAALEGHPTDADALFNLGLLERKEGHLDDAAALFERCLAADPARLPALGNLALVEVARGHPDRARVHLARLLERDPGNARARELLGTLGP